MKNGSMVFSGRFILGRRLTYFGVNMNSRSWNSVNNFYEKMPESRISGGIQAFLKTFTDDY
jgi:hypothetical protein